MRKKMVAILMVAGVMLGTWAATWTDSKTGYTWTYSIDGVGYVGAGIADPYQKAAISPNPIGSLAIPSTLGGKPVTYIGHHAFYNCSLLTSITIPDSVESISGGAFEGCSSLISVMIPNSVKYIYDLSFGNCSSITCATIPQSVCDKKIKDIFSQSYQSITNIVIADGVTTISSNCFMNCSALRTVVVPASVTRIGAEAFYDCVNLEKIIFKGDAPFLGENAFAGTPRRMTVQVPAGSIGWNGGVSTDLPETWGDRIILYFGNYNPPSGGGNSGDGTVVSSDVRYSLSNDIEDRTIANVEIEKDGKIDEFVLKDGKVYDCVIRIVNVSDKETKITLPVGYEYETIGDISPLVLPAKSKSILTITRTAPNTFLVVRQPLSSIQ